jgi:hypothetical protein
LAQLDGPADERRARDPNSHARQYGRSPRDRKRAYWHSWRCYPWPRTLGSMWNSP